MKAEANKTIITAALAVAITVILAGMVLFSQEITQQRAMTEALRHAGFRAEEVVVTHTGLNRLAGRPFYEVVFRKEDRIHELEIDARSGQIQEYRITWTGTGKRPRKRAYQM